MCFWQFGLCLAVSQAMELRVHTRHLAVILNPADPLPHLALHRRLLHQAQLSLQPLQMPISRYKSPIKILLLIHYPMLQLQIIFEIQRDS